MAEAKRTPEWVWLGELSSVVLVQACQDARRAYGNFCDSLLGKRKGRQVGAPRFLPQRDNRQSTRFTRNGFAVAGFGLRLARIGGVPIVWSGICRRSRRRCR